MKNFKRSYFLELPSELIIHVIGFLPFDDLFTLINAGDKRLRECSIIVMKQKQFSKYSDRRISWHHMFIQH